MFQVFDCTCPLPEGREGGETFGDDNKDEFDTKHYKKDEVDWAESQLMRVADCDKLVVNLGSDTANALHKTVVISKITILIENVKKLEISNLDVGYGATASNGREKVASIIFRNLAITEARYDP